MECEKYQTLHAHVVKSRKSDCDHNNWRRSCGCIKTSDKLKELLKAFPSPPPPSPVETGHYHYGHNNPQRNCYLAVVFCEEEILPRQADYKYAVPFSLVGKVHHVQLLALVLKIAPEIKYGFKDRERLVASNCISAYCTDMHQVTPACPVVETEITPYNATEDSPKKAQTSKYWHIVAELVQLVQLSVTATALAIYYLIYCYMQLVYYTLRSALYFHNADGPMKITIGVMTITSLIVGFNLILRMERLILFF